MMSHRLFQKDKGLSADHKSVPQKHSLLNNKTSKNIEGKSLKVDKEICGDSFV